MNKILSVFACVLCLSSCRKMPMEYVNDYFEIEDDNIAEETVEFLVESFTGIDVDQTPRSDE